MKKIFKKNQLMTKSKLKKLNIKMKKKSKYRKKYMNKKLLKIKLLIINRLKMNNNNKIIFWK